MRGTGALFSAIGEHSVEKARVLLELGDLRPEDPELRDALLLAGDPEIVRLLIDHGADLEACDEHGRTPYMRAARFRDPTTMNLLAAAGASKELAPAVEYLGAVVRGELERAAEIREQHPDLELTPDDQEDLPRWASAGETEIVARLLDAGVPIDAPGFQGGTALHYAGHWGRASTVELLLARGADVHLLAGDVPGNALAWTAWGSSHLPTPGSSRWSESWQSRPTHGAIWISVAPCAGAPRRVAARRRSAPRSAPSSGPLRRAPAPRLGVRSPRWYRAPPSSR